MPPSPRNTGNPRQDNRPPCLQAFFGTRARFCLHLENRDQRMKEAWRLLCPLSRMPYEPRPRLAGQAGSRGLNTWRYIAGNLRAPGNRHGEDGRLPNRLVPDASPLIRLRRSRAVTVERLLKTCLRYQRVSTALATSGYRAVRSEILLDGQRETSSCQ